MVTSAWRSLIDNLLLGCWRYPNEYKEKRYLLPILFLNLIFYLKIFFFFCFFNSKIGLKICPMYRGQLFLAKFKRKVSFEMSQNGRPSLSQPKTYFKVMYDFLNRKYDPLRREQDFQAEFISLIGLLSYKVARFIQLQGFYSNDNKVLL